MRLVTATGELPDPHYNPQRRCERHLKYWRLWILSHERFNILVTERFTSDDNRYYVRHPS